MWCRLCNIKHLYLFSSQEMIFRCLEDNLLRCFFEIYQPLSIYGFILLAVAARPWSGPNHPHLLVLAHWCSALPHCMWVGGGHYCWQLTFGLSRGGRPWEHRSITKRGSSEPLEMRWWRGEVILLLRPRLKKMSSSLQGSGHAVEA